MKVFDVQYMDTSVVNLNLGLSCMIEDLIGNESGAAIYIWDGNKKESKCFERSSTVKQRALESISDVAEGMFISQYII